MLEILNILDVKKQKAEAELAELTRKSNQYFWEISSIKENIANNYVDADNLYALEKWRNNQGEKIVIIKEKLKPLEVEIKRSMQNYIRVLTQHIAAKDMASTQENTQALHNEEQETSRALDIFLLSWYHQRKLF